MLIVLVLITLTSANAQELNSKFSGNDIGNPRLKGNFHFDQKNNSFLIEGPGNNIWLKRDTFYFVSQKVSGNFIFSANLKFLSKNSDPQRRIGIMIRNSLENNSGFSEIALYGDNITARQARLSDGGNISTMKRKCVMNLIPDFFKMERKSDTIYYYLRKEGEIPKSYSYRIIKFGDPVYVGMFVNSHNKEVTDKALFWNVHLIKSDNLEKKILLK